MKNPRWFSLLDSTRQVFWALFLVFLPVTSFPYFPPAIGGGALVRPLSIYPLLVLLIITVIPYLWKKPLFPTLLTVLPFIFVALASSLISLFYGIDATLSISAVERLIRALITLGIGFAIYVTVSIVPRTPEQLRSTLRWMYLGISFALLWGSFQAVYVLHFSSDYFKWMNKIQNYISIRRLFNTRVSGLTYEPNWFAEQISFLIIPWLLASVLTGYSVFRWRWKRVTIEWFLLFWALVVLVFTFSRAGLMILVTLIIVSMFLLKPVKGRSHHFFSLKLPLWTRRLVSIGISVIFLVGFIFVIGRNNEFFSRLWNYWQRSNKPEVTDYLNYLGFGARFIYAETALDVYDEHPLLGVGLGNYAFFFKDNLPEQPIAPLPEVLRLITPAENHDRLVTPKNLYLRLMSETGILGVGAFLAFTTAIFGCAIAMRKSHDPETRYWGTAGLLGIAAFLIGAISYDSFAIPNMWVVFGLITAANWVLHKKQSS